MMALMDALPIWVLFFLSAGMALLGCEAGYRIGIRRNKGGPSGGDAPVGTMVGSTLGLLAFIMAFTFGVATTRFETRRLLVVKEANAIGTAYLRTDVLEEPSRTNLKKLLREYLALRVEGARRLSAHELGMEGAKEVIANSNKLQKAIWAETAALGQKHPNWPVYSLFIGCINEMIDTQGERVAAAMSARVPSAVWVGLFLAGTLAMLGTGYYCGLCEKRNGYELAIMSLAFSVALILVVDLDRPFEGSITASQQPMIDLSESIGSQ